MTLLEKNNYEPYVRLMTELDIPYSVVAVQGVENPLYLDSVLKKYSEPPVADRAFHIGGEDYLLLMMGGVGNSYERRVDFVLENLLFNYDGVMLIGIAKGTGDIDSDYRKSLLDAQLWKSSNGVIESPAVKSPLFGKSLDVVCKS